MATYSFADRMLHYLALELSSVAELSFDIDQRMVEPAGERVAAERHVYVSGLARAGTTVLMRRFHDTGLYRSLTYRDMPFVLAPNFWNRLAARSRRDLAPAERAHGDRLMVDADSPESLEEVFWRIFAGDEYIRPDSLRPHAPDSETIERYVRYVGAILQAQPSGTPQAVRYLSKNNNNILRLRAIRRAFPRALMLIPFREPGAHAASLLRQHVNFSKLHQEDRFSRTYMTWVAHHEFGQDHRPFVFADDPAPEEAEPASLDYWIALWCRTYEWLERSAPEDAVFVCYEDLCRDPGVWTALARTADVPDEESSGAAFTPSAAPDTHTGDPRLLERANTVYDRLVRMARSAV